MRPPAALTLIAVLAGMFALAGFAHAAMHAQGSGSAPASFPLAALALGYGLGALATAIGVWKVRRWALYAFLTWMGLVSALMAGQQAIQGLYGSWWGLVGAEVLVLVPLTFVGAWFIRRHTVRRG